MKLPPRISVEDMIRAIPHHNLALESAFNASSLESSLRSLVVSSDDIEIRIIPIPVNKTKKIIIPNTYNRP